MSGTTRAITLTLSVRDADKVRQELERIGPAGEAAIRRLDAAARAAAGSGGSMPALATATQQAGSQLGNLRNVAGQAGYQIQDFVVQVQSGTSALTALSQQGSQFLGIFGPAGAAAGAILTIGLLVTQILRGGDATKQWTDALKAQQDAFRNATDAAERWRTGLGAEAERVVQLRDYYQQLSSERQQFELRAANRDQQTLAQRETALRSEIERTLGGLTGSFQTSLTAARDAANAYPRGSAERTALEEFIANDRDLARMREAIAALERFRSTGSLTTEDLANLTVTLRALAEGNDNVSQRLRAATGSMEQQAGPVRELEEAQRQLNERLTALGAGAGTLDQRLEALRQRLILLRQTTLNNPTAGLDAEIARTAERAGALARGGLPLYEGVQSLQQQQDNARRYAEQAEREFRATLRSTGMGEDQIGSEVDRTAADRTFRAMQRAQQEADLAAAVERERERQREAERNARSGARSAAAEQRRKDAQNTRDYNAILTERESLLRAIETPQEKFNRQIEQLNRLEQQLADRARGNPDAADTVITSEQRQRITEGFQREMDEANRRARGVDDVGRQLGLTFTSAFEDAIVKGKDFRDVLKGIEQDIARLIIRKAITEPAANAIQGINWSGLATSIVSGLFGGSSTPTGYTYGAGGYYGAGPFTASANGNAFSGGNVIPFARGGVVTRPTMFPMANGAGLMGEAGPEAVMPLQRDNRGRLGVVAQGGGGNSISQTINIDARGADAGVDQKIRAAIAIAVRQANAQLLADINRGGSTAKQVGRRA